MGVRRSYSAGIVSAGMAVLLMAETAAAAAQGEKTLYAHT
jgi:hypothetical protein